MGVSNVLHLKTFDANKDNLIDLIVTTDKNNGEVIIYEVPMTKAFTWVFPEYWNKLTNKNSININTKYLHCVVICKDLVICNLRKKGSFIIF